MTCRPHSSPSFTPRPRAARPWFACASLALLGASVSTTAQAQDKREPQYRILELTDGRTLTAEILGTEATGLSLRTPQGDSLVSFELLVDMQPTDAAGYQAQGDWVVYVAVSKDLQASTLDLLEGIPGISSHPVGSAVNGLSADDANAALACDGRLDCLVDAASAASGMWILTSDTDAEGNRTLAGGLTQGRTRTEAKLDDDSRDALWSGIHQAIGLLPPSKAPPEAVSAMGSAPKAAGEMTPGKVTALSFVPLPGTSAIAQKDWGNVGLAWGIAVPSAALFVVGSAASQDKPDFGNPGFLLSAAGGSYLSIVFANQVTGMRAYQKGKDRKVGLSPMPVQGGGGAMVVVR
jgi:hypothetical protein